MPNPFHCALWNSVSLANALCPAPLFHILPSPCCFDSFPKTCSAHSPSREATFHTYFLSSKTLASTYSYSLLSTLLYLPQPLISTIVPLGLVNMKNGTFLNNPSFQHPVLLPPPLSFPLAPSSISAQQFFALIRTKVFGNILLFSLTLTPRTGPSREPVAPTAKQIQKRML